MTGTLGDTVDLMGDVEASELSVLVVDDHQVFADSVSLAIDTEPGLRCTGTVGTAQEAVRSVAVRCPDVVLLDLNLPGMSGLEVIPELRHGCPEARVVVLTANTSLDTVLAAIEAGADAFLPKEQPFADVVMALRDAEGSSPLDRRSIGAVLTAAGRTPDVSDGVRPVLTDREHQVLLRLADGDPVKAIALQLDISVHTCRGHIRGLLSKFDAHSQLEAVVKAARLGMLPRLRTDGP